MEMLKGPTKIHLLGAATVMLVRLRVSKLMAAVVWAVVSRCLETGARYIRLRHSPLLICLAATAFIQIMLVYSGAALPLRVLEAELVVLTRTQRLRIMVAVVVT
jgi:hypothetical protein